MAEVTVSDWGRRCPRWAGVRSDWLDVRGTSVHVLRAGDDVDGPPQLLVHGLGGAASNWLEVIPQLAQRGPVVAPDLPGFGRTAPPRPAAAHVRSNAAFLHALVDELGWSAAEVHGNSMGGLLATLLAARCPTAVGRLVLVSPALTMSRAAIPRLDPMTWTGLVPFLVPGLGASLLRRAHRRTTPEELFADAGTFIHGDVERVSPELTEVGLENLAFGRDHPWRLESFAAAAQSLIRALAVRRRVERAIRQVTAPTLVIWGDSDRLVGRAVIDRVERLQPQWQVVVLEGVGHAPMAESPQDYLAAVDAWRSGRSDPPEAVEQPLSS